MIRILVSLILLQGCASAVAETCSGVYSLEDTGWYEGQMKAAGIQPLCSTNSPHTEHYRFTWLRTFDNPVIVTLIRAHRDIELVGIRLDGQGGYEPGRIVEEKRGRISYAEFVKFERYLRKMDFWNLKSRNEIVEAAMKDNPGEIMVGVDGARWILEGADSDRAHAADRWSDVEGPFKDAALFLLRKSGVHLNGPVD